MIFSGGIAILGIGFSEKFCCDFIDCLGPGAETDGEITKLSGSLFGQFFENKGSEFRTVNRRRLGLVLRKFGCRNAQLLPEVDYSVRVFVC